MTTEESERITAYHEAGHLVLCYVLQIHFGPITIEPEDKDLAGLLKTDFPDDIDSREDQDEVMKNHLLITLAGPEAEEIFTGREFDWDDPVLSGDREIVVELGSRLYGYGDIRRQIGEDMAETKSVLSRHWKTVQRVAELLLDRRTLTADEALAVLNQTSTGACEKGTNI